MNNGLAVRFSTWWYAHGTVLAARLRDRGPGPARGGSGLQTLWLAEHHSVEGWLVHNVGADWHVAGATTTIRVAAGSHVAKSRP